MAGFYGGKEGRSFVITKSFNTIAEMVEAFANGPSYAEVNFDEYVLINTVNKNSPENGRVYRRGYNFNDEMHGAIYVGTIVGPAGHAPLFNFDLLSSIESRGAVAEDVDFSGNGSFDGALTKLSKTYPNGRPDGVPCVKAIINTGAIGYFYYNEATSNWYLMDSSPLVGEGSYYPGVDFVPGYDGENYNDTIDWKYCTIRDENKSDSTAFVGFKFVYPVFEVEAEQISAYDEPLATKIDDGIHPFYNKWKFSIPKGIKGESVFNLRVETVPVEGLVVPALDENGNLLYNNYNEVDKEGALVIVFDYIDYDEDATAREEGVKHTCYLGDFNQISNVELANNGTFTVELTHDNNAIFDQALTWITDCTYNKETGDFTITFNNEKINTISGNLNYIKKTSIDENGHLIMTHSSSDKGEQDLGPIYTTVAAPATENVNDKLAVGGLWFITESIDENV